MEICYDGALVTPKNYAVVNKEEMEYVDGGEITLAAATAMIGGLIAAGLATVNIEKECGKYCYNNGYSRNGIAMTLFSAAGAGIFGPGLSILFNIGLDNGWVEASK